MNHKVFSFVNYSFDRTSKTLSLKYAVDDKYQFEETYKFDFAFVDYDKSALDRALQLLFLVAGVSYFKAFLPPVIKTSQGSVDQELSKLLSQIYQKGLGEFFYVNKLDPKTQVKFPVNSETLNKLSVSGKGSLVAIGGGKDSLVGVELLKKQSDLATWSLGHKQQLAPLVKKIGLPHYFVERQIDKQLLKLTAQPGVYKGHIPISAIFATVGVVVAILSGHRDVVVSNESSASEPSLTYKGVAINHQWSKSLEFEIIFKSYLNHIFGDSVRYYSLLRPFSELRIAELFAKKALPKSEYSGVFSSCNQAFRQGETKMFWCGECAKCAFTFLVLTPFVNQEKLEQIFGDRNLLLDSGLEPTYRQLLGIEGDKPLDCVGEIKESRAAMQLAQNKYPELKKYQFNLPNNYDYRAKGPDKVPKDIKPILQNF